MVEFRGICWCFTMRFSGRWLFLAVVIPCRSYCWLKGELLEGSYRSVVKEEARGK